MIENVNDNINRYSNQVYFNNELNNLTIENIVHADWNDSYELRKKIANRFIFIFR